MTMNTYSLQPIYNTSTETYSAQNSKSGKVLNLVCIAGIYGDGKIKIEPFNFSSNELVQKASAILENKLFGTVQMIPGKSGNLVALQIDPSLKKHLISDKYTLSYNNQIGTKICDIDGISLFDETQLSAVSNIFRMWYQKAKKQPTT